MSNVTDVQLMIGDPAGDLFTDAQIADFLRLSETGGVENVFSAAALACRSLAASGVLLAKVESIGNYSLSRATLVEKYLKLADEYQGRVDEIPAVGVFEQSWTPANAIDIIFNDALRDT